MNPIKSIALIVALFVFVGSAQAVVTIVPKPAKVEETCGAFQITPETAVSGSPAELVNVAVEQLKLKRAEGASAGSIVLSTNPVTATGAEGYELVVTPQRITIAATKPAGVFYGIQSLKQMTDRDGKVPACKITDQPRFGYRGLMLDSSRHMQSKEYILSLLDRMSELKLNRFHWHLSDDRGWRIESKKYPKLNEVGSWADSSTVDPRAPRASSSKPGRYGGFYTQSDIREIVAYADARFITIIPEVDLPGHTTDIVASYPELGCTRQQIPVRYDFWGADALLCLGDERTYQFVEGMLTELMELFPKSPVIHTGGDECSHRQWLACPVCQAKMKEMNLKDGAALQGYFSERIAKFLASKGRRMQGWDEIREGTNLPPGVIVQQWRNPKAAKLAAEAGLDVVCSPSMYCYFDHIHNVLPTEMVLSYDPVPEDLKPELAGRILGAQGNLWAETLATEADVDVHAFPRALAMAEIDWSPKDPKGGPKDFNDFCLRAQSWIDRQPPEQRLGLKQRLIGNIDYGQPIAMWSKIDLENKPTFEKDITQTITGPGTYRVTFEWRASAWLLTEQVTITPGGSTDKHAGYTGVVGDSNQYDVTIDQYDSKAKYMLQVTSRGRQSANSTGQIFVMKMK
jgi:hexosaminidase